jgi:hypothetical protein
MKRIILKIVLFCLPFVVAIVVLFSIPVEKDFAYHFIKGNCYDHGSWVYDRVFKNETSIDVAFIGSSRTLHAVNEVEIEKLVNDSVRPSLNIANLGYCEPGRDFQYAVLKDLLKQKQPKLVVIEVTEDEQRSAHPSFPYIADITDLLASPMLNEFYLKNLFKALSMRWEFVKYHYLFNNTIYTTDLAKYGYAKSERIVTDEELDKNLNYWNRRMKRDHSSFFGKHADSYPLSYLEKSIALLNEKGVDYCFLFIPTVNGMVDHPIFQSYYEKQAKVYFLNRSLVSGVGYWMDATHLNDKGSTGVAIDLVQLINNELCSNQ